MNKKLGDDTANYFLSEMAEQVSHLCLLQVASREYYASVLLYSQNLHTEQDFDKWLVCPRVTFGVLPGDCYAVGIFTAECDLSRSV